MILRKPYAFLIKNFKLMHAILTVLISYLLYKSNTILHFFNEYLESVQIISDTEVISKVFHILIFAFPFLVIVFSIIIL